jgi:hypothetical protein
VLTALALCGLAIVPSARQLRDQTFLRFKEERMVIEYTPAADEAVVRMDAENEGGVDRVEVRDPRGVTRLSLQAQHGRIEGIQGMVIESREMGLDDLLATYRQGTYSLRGRSVDGLTVIGSAVLSHELLAEPVVLYPTPGEQGVPAERVKVAWIPDAQADRYRVVLEQGESDGLAVELPAGSSSFLVPEGVLRDATETFVEIAAIASNGNSTTVEVPFTTR